MSKNLTTHIYLASADSLVRLAKFMKLNPNKSREQLVKILTERLGAKRSSWPPPKLQ